MLKYLLIMIYLNQMKCPQFILMLVRFCCYSCSTSSVPQIFDGKLTIYIELHENHEASDSARADLVFFPKKKCSEEGMHNIGFLPVQCF